MKRTAFLTAMAALMLGAYAQQKSYSLEVRDFSELTVASGVNVVYRSLPDSAGWACYSCDPAVASAVTFSNDKNKLKIQIVSDGSTAQLPTVYVYSLALNKINNWGDSTVIATDVNCGASFKATVIGNGRIEALGLATTKVEGAVEAGQGHVFLTGNAQYAKYTIMSAGAVEAGHMQAAEVKCMIAGTGSIDCFATEKLSVLGLGSGHVYYRGNPSVKNRCMGVKINKID